MKQTTLSKANEKFWAATPEQKRVAIAKDVIKQIRAKFYKPESGTYFQIDLPDSYGIRVTDSIEKFDKAMTSIKRKGGTCEVCAIGGCFASLVRLGDKINTEEVVSDHIESNDSINDYFMKKKLKDIFSDV